MKAIILSLFLILTPAAVAAQSKIVAASPDKRVDVLFSLNAAGAPHYSVRHGGKIVLTESRLGLVRDDADFTRGLKIASVSRPVAVRDRYETLTSKRRLNDYRGTRAVVTLLTGDRKRIEIIFQVSNDGVAFRYRFPDRDENLRRLLDEATTFGFAPGTKAWLQPKAPAHTGWSLSQPSYEEYYEKEIPVGTPSTLGAGWVFPALFRSGETWIAVTESGFQSNYSGGYLAHESTGGSYKLAFPDAKETRGDREAVNPESTLPWETPWRVVAVGSLRTVVESTLGTDVAEPSNSKPDPSLPGKSSWSWVLMGDPNTKFEVQKDFVDYAASMGWRYCLVDALWDKQIGYEKIAELVEYARAKNVRIILWYNSAGTWNTTPQTPRSMLLTHESRMKEFDRLKKIGVAGLKVDFFGGDGQSFMKYYRDILDDAAKFGFVMNFHGATLPRGLARTYPNLMTMEAVRGFEFVTFAQENADKEASHAAMLPFTRNLFDPMDFTPFAPSHVNSRITRRTTSAFELATTVLFTSGIQHYAETPEGMAKLPDYVREFMKTLPSVWDEVKFIDGYPGKFVVIARRAGPTWYISGINGEDVSRTVSLDLRTLRTAGRFELIGDESGENLAFSRSEVNARKPITIKLEPHGGFVLRSL